MGCDNDTIIRGRKFKGGGDGLDKIVDVVVVEGELINNARRDSEPDARIARINNAPSLDFCRVISGS